MANKKNILVACIYIWSLLFDMWCIYVLKKLHRILIFLRYTTQTRGTKKTKYYINHDDATQRLVIDNVTWMFRMLSYILQHGRKIFGEMVFKVEIPTKVNAKTVWRNNKWKDQLGSTAIICRIIYRYIFIVVGKLQGLPSWWSFWMRAKWMFWNVEQKNGHQHIAKGRLVSRPSQWSYTRRKIIVSRLYCKSWGTKKCWY